MELPNHVRICIPICELKAAESTISAALLSQACPSIITFRPAEQGGRRSLTLEDRVLFRPQELWWHSEQRQSTTYVDVELDLALLLQQRATDDGYDTLASRLDWQRVICSHHDFVRVPSDLDQLYERMANTRARILKIAVQADDITDCLAVFRLLERAQKDGREMIAIAMGTAGIVTRILGPS